MKITLIKPDEFKVVRVISFRDKYTKRFGTICYMRPYALDYNKGILDDFDNSMIIWLKSLNLSNVELIYSEDMLFDYQLPQLLRIYNGGRPSSKLSLVCHGDYSHDEFVAMGQIDAVCFELNVFWNADKNDLCPQLSGIMTFDKNKENYYRDVIKTIKSL